MKMDLKKIPWKKILGLGLLVAGIAPLLEQYIFGKVAVLAYVIPFFGVSIGLMLATGTAVVLSEYILIKWLKIRI